MNENMTEQDRIDLQNILDSNQVKIPLENFPGIQGMARPKYNNNKKNNNSYKSHREENIATPSKHNSSFVNF